MIRPKRALCLLLAALLLPLSALADDGADAARLKAREERAHSLANMTLSILQDQKKSFSDREATLSNGILSMVDVEWIAKFVLGAAWKSASPMQRQHYTRLYGEYLARMYISNFAQSDDRKIQDIKILGIADSEETTYVVRSLVKLSTDENLHVDYMVHEKNGTHQIIDVVLEGVSLITAHRAEFSKLAAARGVDGVIARLEQLARAPAPEMKLSMQ